MTEPSTDMRPKSKKLPLALFVLLLAGICYFFLNSEYQTSFAGIGALIAIPAAIGGLLAYFADVKSESTALGWLVWPIFAILSLCAVAFLFLGEGAICIAMVLPIWIPAAIIAYAVSIWVIRTRNREDKDHDQFYSITWLLFPSLFITIDQVHPPQWETRTVTREVRINAPPNDIWPLLVSIPKIEKSEGKWNITQNLLGVPKPVDAKLLSVGTQLVRKAQWAGGVRFEERINHVDQFRSIGWDFAFPDDSIQTHIDRHVSPDGGILKIKTGRYDLESISPTQTRVRLTTNYQMRTRLVDYLGWWGEQLLGDIQENILSVIHDRANKHGNALATAQKI